MPTEKKPDRLSLSDAAEKSQSFEHFLELAGMPETATYLRADYKRMRLRRGAK